MLLMDRKSNNNRTEGRMRISIKNKRYFFVLLSVFAILLVFYLFQFLIGEKPKVAVVLRDLNLENYETIKKGAEKGFEDFGIQGRVMFSQEGTVEEQKKILEKVFKDKPDAVVVSPLSPDVIPQLDEFIANDIPVLFVNLDLPWSKKTSYIGTNHYNLGKRSGELMASKLQPGDKVAIIGRSAIAEGERIRGASESLEKVEIKIITEIVETAYDPDMIRNAMEKVLGENPDIKGVIASTDFVALPALEVIQEHELEIPVIGAEGITEMLQQIQQGNQSIGIAQNPYDMGYLSVEAALKAIKGEKVNSRIDIGVDFITQGNAEQRLEFLNKVLE